MINGTDYYRRYEPLFGEWRIDKLIGEGSSGEVFKIIKNNGDGTTSTEALKAICIPKSETEFKMLRHDGFTPESARSYLQDVAANIVREYSLMAQMNGNPHIVGYRDHVAYRHDNGIGWDILIRMELLTPVADYFESRELTVRDIIKLGIHICRALELCHGQNVIHRDIKPENIFADANGNFKLGDFGIAREVEKTQAGLTKTGTITYMAPEVFRGDPYGKTIDIYSLGIVLYKFVNHNRVPFSPRYPEPVTYDSRDAANMARMRGEKIPYPDGTSFREFADIILKACSYRPEDRFRSATEMRMALEALFVGQLTEFDADKVTAKSAEHIDINVFGSSPVIPETQEKREAMAIPEIAKIAPGTTKKKSFLDNKLAVVLAVFVTAAVIIAIILVIFFNSGSSGKRGTPSTGGNGKDVLIDTGGGVYDPAPPITPKPVPPDNPDPVPPKEPDTISPLETEQNIYGKKIVSAQYNNSNITFTLYEDNSKRGVLVVSGSGDIADYGYRDGGCIPSAIKDTGIAVRKVVIESGINTVGQCAFYNLTSVNDLEVSAANIKKYAFGNCSNLKNVMLHNGVEYVLRGAFENCEKIEELIFPVTIREIHNCVDKCSMLETIIVPSPDVTFKVDLTGIDDKKDEITEKIAGYTLFNGCADNFIIKASRKDGASEAYRSLNGIYKLEVNKIVSWID